jgi:hypothetical protein
MSTTLATKDEIVEAAQRLPPADIDWLLSEIVLMRAKTRGVPVLSRRESELFREINRAPDWDAKRRMEELIRLRQDERISPGELNELIRLTDADEERAARLLECLLELAAIRGMTLDELRRQLGLPERMSA